MLVQLCCDKPEPEIKDSVCLDAGQSQLLFVPVGKVREKECMDGWLTSGPNAS